MQEQGITPSVVENAINNGQKFPARGTADRFYDSTNDVTVLVDKSSGRIITADYGNFGE